MKVNDWKNLYEMSKKFADSEVKTTDIFCKSVLFENRPIDMKVVIRFYTQEQEYSCVDRIYAFAVVQDRFNDFTFRTISYELLGFSHGDLITWVEDLTGVSGGRWVDVTDKIF